MYVVSLAGTASLCKKEKKMNIRPLESLTKEELIELIKHEHRDEPVAWQPIETAPEEGCWAIVYGDGAVDCMFIRKGHVPENWTNPNNPNLNPSKVTHWMSIPKFGEEG